MQPSIAATHSSSELKIACMGLCLESLEKNPSTALIHETEARKRTGAVEARRAMIASRIQAVVRAAQPPGSLAHRPGGHASSESGAEIFFLIENIFSVIILAAHGTGRQRGDRVVNPMEG